MEIIESFQAFKNLADRTFRGRSLGYQDEYEPEVDVAERSNARQIWRSRAAGRISSSPILRQSVCHTGAQTMSTELEHQTELT